MYVVGEVRRCVARQRREDKTENTLVCSQRVSELAASATAAKPARRGASESHQSMADA